MNIGEKIKQLRTQQKMTLKELANKSKVALATLSRMENNKMTGTLECHNSIARALGITLTELYSEIITEEKKVEIHSHNAPADTFVHTQKSSFKILTNKALSKKMMPVLLTIQPGGQTNQEETNKGVEKFLYVTGGALEAYIGNETFTLHKNDTLYFDASLAHYFKNTSKVTANAICVICPPAL